MTIERPMFPPRAESVDSFSHPAAIGRPQSGNLASDSRKPVGGLSRRAALAGLAALSALPAAAAAEPDPVYAAIELYRKLSIEFTAAVERSGNMGSEDSGYEEAEAATDAAGDALFAQMKLIFTFRPSTIAGTVALLKYISTLEGWQMPPGLEDDSGKENAQAFCLSLAAALEQIGGV